MLENRLHFKMHAALDNLKAKLAKSSDAGPDSVDLEDDDPPQDGPSPGPSDGTKGWPDRWSSGWSHKRNGGPGTLLIRAQFQDCLARSPELVQRVPARPSAMLCCNKSPFLESLVDSSQNVVESESFSLVTRVKSTTKSDSSRLESKSVTRLITTLLLRAMKCFM